LPLVISFGLRSIYSIVDTVFAAGLEGVGDESIAAIGLTVPLEFLMTAFWVGASNGLTAKLAEAMGIGRGARVEELKRAAMKIIVAFVGLFLALAAAIWSFADDLGLEPVLAHQFRIYATVLMAGSAVTAFWSILPDSIVKAHHDTTSTMWAGLISGSTNVALNTLFVFGFGLGIFGIALSTVLGRVFALLYALGRAAKHERGRRERAVGRPVLAMPEGARGPIRDILFIAIPSGITFVVMAIESMAINWIVKESPDSTAALAAWSIFDRATSFLSMPMIAIGVAMLPLVARLWGEGDVASVRRQVGRAGLAGLGYFALVVVPGVALFWGVVAEELSESHEVRRLTLAATLWVPLATAAKAPFFPVRSVFEGMGLPRPGLVVSAVRMVALVVPLTWLCVELAPAMGQEPVVGAYAGSTLGTVVASIWLTLWMRRTLRRR
jgi:Na+-driven multidrug efflux pump